MERFSAQQLHGIECKISSQALVDLKTLTTVWIDKLPSKNPSLKQQSACSGSFAQATAINLTEIPPKSFEQGQIDQ